MLNNSCNEFLNQLASGAAVPGGGGASALCGALGAALGSMVCNLTLGKKKYAGVQQDIQRIIGRTEELRNQLQQLVQADADAFEPLSKAYGLPKDAPERDQVMAQCLKDAGAVPLRIMETCAQVVELLEELAEKGSRLALSDVGVAAVFCRAALEGASLNVYINTKLMKDRALAEDYESQADGLLAQWTSRADKTAQIVQAAIRK